MLPRAERNEDEAVERDDVARHLFTAGRLQLLLTAVGAGFLAVGLVVGAAAPGPGELLVAAVALVLAPSILVVPAVARVSTAGLSLIVALLYSVAQVALALVFGGANPGQLAWLGFVVTLLVNLVVLGRAFQIGVARLAAEIGVRGSYRPSAARPWSADTLAEVDKEMSRSRRYERPLAVSLLVPTASPDSSLYRSSSKVVDRRLMERVLRNRLAGVVEIELRRTDMLIDRPDGRTLVLFSPETTAEGAEALLTRIQNRAQIEAGINVVAGTAHFPEEALTFEGLLDCAESWVTDTARGPGGPTREQGETTTGLRGDGSGRA